MIESFLDNIKIFFKKTGRILTKSKFGLVSENVRCWRRPLEDVEKLSLGAKRKNTQVYVTAEESPFRIYQENGNYYLIEKFDHTFAWINKKYVQLITLHKYNELKCLGQEVKTEILDAQCLVADIKLFFQKYKDTPYVWGGVSVEGIDCSGFIQRFFIENFNLILPKNSVDQSKKGVSVRQEDLFNYDIVYMKHIKTEIGHIGLYFSGDLYHVCLEKKGLVHDKVDNVLKKYLFIHARRIIRCK